MSKIKSIFREAVQDNGTLMQSDTALMVGCWCQGKPIDGEPMDATPIDGWRPRGEPIDGKPLAITDVSLLVVHTWTLTQMCAGVLRMCYALTIFYDLRVTMCHWWFVGEGVLALGGRAGGGRPPPSYTYINIFVYKKTKT